MRMSCMHVDYTHMNGGRRSSHYVHVFSPRPWWLCIIFHTSLGGFVSYFTQALVAVYRIWQCGNTMEWEIFGISINSIFRLGVGNLRDFQFPRHCAQENAYIHVWPCIYLYIRVYTRMRVRTCRDLTRIKFLGNFLILIF